MYDIYLLCRTQAIYAYLSTCTTYYDDYTYSTDPCLIRRICYIMENVQVCEQTFRWFNTLVGILASMTPAMFKFTVYHLIHEHSERLVEIWKHKPPRTNVVQI